MNNLIRQSELATNEDNEFKAYSLRNNFDETGIFEEYAQLMEESRASMRKSWRGKVTGICEPLLK